MGMFQNGKNCGRWVEITFTSNCVGHGHDSHKEPPDICGVNPYEQDVESHYKADGISSHKAYAVVADSCQDNNYWCAKPSNAPGKRMQCTGVPKGQRAFYVGMFWPKLLNSPMGQKHNVYLFQPRKVNVLQLN
jgi:hypothetical protein